jgi:hypothetical protein
MCRSLADREACREKKQCDPQNPPHDDPQAPNRALFFFRKNRKWHVCVEQGNLDGVEMVCLILSLKINFSKKSPLARG